MIAWILYVMLVSLLLGLAALAFERSALLRKNPTRWLWGTSIIASLAVPFAVASISVQIPTLTDMLGPAADHAVALRQMTSGDLSPSYWLAQAGTAGLAASADLNSVLKTVWRVASLVLFLAILASGIQLYRRQRGWEQSRMAGQKVLIAEDVGPAVVGLLRSQIVVPRWLVRSSPSEQALVIAHEQSHLEANDAQLLTIALCLIVCMPWNLPLWWQLRRLRRAMEVDCDARVLRRGHDIAAYGETLIAVGERQSGGLAVIAAMSESKSFLEQRIRIMLRKKTKFAWVSALALAFLGAVLAAGAADVSPPNKPDHQEIALDGKILEGYAGIYQFTGSSILTVTRNAQQLSAQLTGQPAVPIFAEGKTDFFYKIVDAQITFVPNAQGVADSLVLHQNGANITMKRIDSATAQRLVNNAQERFASQSANPNSEAALRRTVEGLMSGTPNYDEMSPALADAVRKQLPKLSNLGQQGAIKSIKFLGVSNDGSDSYSVIQEKAATHWVIALDSDNIIVIALVTPGP